MLLVPRLELTQREGVALATQELAAATGPAIRLALRHARADGVDPALVQRKEAELEVSWQARPG